MRRREFITFFGSSAVAWPLAASSEIGDRWCLPRIYMAHARLLQQASRNAEAVEANLLKALEAMCKRLGIACSDQLGAVMV